MNPKKTRMYLVLFLCILLTVLPFSTVSAAKKYKNQLVKTNQKLYYYNSKGKKIKKTWKTVKGKTYYFSSGGAAVKGLQTIKKKRYIFGSDYVLQKNRLVTYKNKTYYPDKKGVLRKGWVSIGSRKYYFLSSGEMALDCFIGGRYVDSAGIYQPSVREPLDHLKTKLTTQLKKYSGTWSVYVRNLNTNESFSIKNKKMYAASEIKLFALAAAYEQIEQGKFSESSVYSSLFVPMITVSDNTAFNKLIRKIGTQTVDNWCEANGYKNTQQRAGSTYGSCYSGTVSPRGGMNQTCVEDLGKLLESIYDQTCVSKYASDRMLQLLKAQTRRSKIPAGIPRGVVVANKTGENDDYTHDCAIVYSKGATYIICVMARCPGYAWSAASHIPSISKTVYDFFN